MTICAIICTYNRDAYLSTAITSVLDQSRPADEVIVVYDGGSIEHFDSFKKVYPTVKFIYQENQGRSIAANRAVFESQCDFVAFLDDDDYWLPQKLEIVEKALSESGMDAINHFFDIIDENGVVSSPNCDHMLVRNKQFPHLVVRNPCAFSTSVISRSVYIIAGGLSPFQTTADDWTLYMNVSRICEWLTLPDRLCCYRVHANQGSSDVNVGLRILTQIAAYYFGGRPCRSSRLDVDVRDLPVGLFEHAGVAFWNSLSKCNVRRLFQTWCVVALFVGNPFVISKLVAYMPPVRFRVDKLIQVFRRIRLQ